MGFWDDHFGSWEQAGQTLTDPGGFLRAPKVDQSLAHLQDADYMRDLIKSQAQPSQHGASAQNTQLGATPQIQGTQYGQAAQIGTGAQDQSRGYQTQLLGQLAAQASGQRQGAGELAAQRQATRAAAQQQAMARMGRGGNAALAARGAARNTADIGVQGAGMAQQAAMQDQSQAQGMLGQLAGQARGQDIGLAQGQAELNQQRMLAQGGVEANRALQQAQMQQQTGLQQGQMDQQTAMANLQAEMTQRGMNAQQQQQMLDLLFRQNQAEMAARMGQAQVGAQQQQQNTGNMLQAAGTIAAIASDEKLKSDVKHGGRDIDDLLDKLSPKTYRYKAGVPSNLTGAVGDGRKITGILAQNLESSKMGRAIVSDTDVGKVVDMRGAVSAALAASARLNERLRELEKKKRRK